MTYPLSISKYISPDPIFSIAVLTECTNLISNPSHISHPNKCESTYCSTDNDLRETKRLLCSIITATFGQIFEKSPFEYFSSLMCEMLSSPTNNANLFNRVSSQPSLNLGGVSASKLMAKLQSVDPGYITKTKGPTALMCAAKFGHTIGGELLIKAGADLDLQDQFGETALIKAIANRKVDFSKALIKAGADVNLATNGIMNTVFFGASNLRIESGTTPLIYATIGNQLSVVSDLIHAGAIIDTRNFAGQTALNLASAGKADHVAKLLIEAQADPDSASIDGITPLVNAASRGYADMVKLLIDAKADLNKSVRPNIMTNFLFGSPFYVAGTTPLMSAASNGHFKVVHLLLKAGADKELKNSLGQTAMMLASSKHSQVKALLQNPHSYKDEL